MAQRGQLAFTDPEELEQRIEEYFASRIKRRKVFPKDGDPYEEEYQVPPTMAGLALALDTTRVTILHYGRGDGERDPRFISIIARAKMRIAEFAEEALYTQQASRGAAFALAVNHGYGKEAEVGAGEGLSVVMIPPAGEPAQKAIPKWQPGGEDDE